MLLSLLFLMLLLLVVADIVMMGNSPLRVEVAMANEVDGAPGENAREMSPPRGVAEGGGVHGLDVLERGLMATHCPSEDVPNDLSFCNHSALCSRISIFL